MSISPPAGARVSPQQWLDAAKAAVSREIADIVGINFEASRVVGFSLTVADGEWPVVTVRYDPSGPGPEEFTFIAEWHLNDGAATFGEPA